MKPFLHYDKYDVDLTASITMYITLASPNNMAGLRKGHACTNLLL